MTEGQAVLPFSYKLSVWRRVGLFLAGVLMILLGLTSISGLYESEALMFLLLGVPFIIGGAALSVMIFFLPSNTIDVTEEGITLNFEIFKKPKRKILWADIVRIQAVRAGKNKSLAIETKQDQERMSKEGYLQSFGRFAVGRLASDGGMAGIYIADSFMHIPVEKAAEQLNAILASRQAA